MTHLYIEQNTGLTEEVNSSIISKLYELAISGDLDNTSDLKGRLHTTAAYESHVNWLNEHYDELIISADDKYVDFVSKDIEANLATEYGDGIGVYYSNRANVTNFYKHAHTETINGSTFEFNFNDGRCAFVNNQRLTSFNELSLFPNLKSIPEACFAYSSLSSIDLSNIETLGDMAFSYCQLSGVINAPKLKSFPTRTINITYFHESGSQFRQNRGITEINIGADVSEGNKVKVIPVSCMRAIDNLTKVTGLSEVTHIEGYAFAYDPNLQSIDTTSNLTEVYERAFFQDSSLKCINLSNVTIINQNAFQQCSSLIDITTSDPTQIDPNAEYLDLSLPNLTQIQGNAFRECTKIKTVSNLGQITELPSAVFYGCTELTSLVLPSTLKTLYCQAFGQTPIERIIGIEGLTTMVLSQYVTLNGSLKYVEVPSTVTNMKDFFHRSLEGNNGTGYSCICVVKATVPPTLSYYTPNGGEAQIGSTTQGASRFLGIYVPDASLSDYLAAGDAWQNSGVQSKLKPISQLQTDSPTYWAVYQAGLSNS